MRLLKRFAKVFDFENGQLLITKAFETSEDNYNYQIKVETKVNMDNDGKTLMADITASAIYAYSSKSIRDKEFDKLDHEKASNLFDMILNEL